MPAPRLKQIKLVVIALALIGITIALTQIVREKVSFDCQELVGALNGRHSDILPYIYILFLSSSAIIPLPGTLLVLVAGFLFGAIKGTVVSVIGMTLAATFSFLIGKTLKKVMQPIN